MTRLMSNLILTTEPQVSHVSLSLSKSLSRSRSRSLIISIIVLIYYYYVLFDSVDEPPALILDRRAYRNGHVNPSTQEDTKDSRFSFYHMIKNPNTEQLASSLSWFQPEDPENGEVSSDSSAPVITSSSQSHSHSRNNNHNPSSSSSSSTRNSQQFLNDDGQSSSLSFFLSFFLSFSISHLGVI